MFCGRKGRIARAAYQNSILSRQYELLQKAYADNAMLFHDMDHHLQTIWHLAQKEDNAAILEYIAGISAPVRELSGIVWTGVGIVDAILNAKKELAQKKGYILDIDAELPGNTGIAAEDFCTILSNLLDNALDAMERMKDGPKEEPIRVTIRRINHFLIVEVANPCKEDGHRKKGIFGNTGISALGHGWGLRSVRQAVLKYGGSFSCSMEEGWFRATAMLFFALDEKKT